MGRMSRVTFSIIVFFTSIHSMGDLRAGEKPEAATIAVRGRIWTANPQQPWAEAIAILGDRIVAVGSVRDIEKFVTSETEAIHAGDGLVVPGLIDSHIHLIDGGLRLASVQLRDAKS